MSRVNCNLYHACYNWIMGTPLIAFMHIPKCAGTTLAGILTSVYGKGFIHVKDAVIGKGHLEKLDYAKVDAVLGHFSFGALDFVGRDVKYVCFFRNTLQRLVSYYWFILYDKTNSKHAWTMTTSFYEWVQSRKLACHDNDLVRFMSGRQDINYDTPGRSVDIDDLEKAINNLRKLAFVGIQEDFDCGIIQVADLLSWGKFPKYENKRVQSKRPEYNSLPAQTLTMLRESQKHDLVLYKEVERLYISQGE